MTFRLVLWAAGVLLTYAFARIMQYHKDTAKRRKIIKINHLAKKITIFLQSTFYESASPPTSGQLPLSRGRQLHKSEGRAALMVNHQAMQKPPRPQREQILSPGLVLNA